jgi:hypothetical protein
MQLPVADVKERRRTSENARNIEKKWLVLTRLLI